MAARNRRDVFDKSTVGIYHCFSKTVRGLFFMGYDAVRRRDATYRRAWVHNRAEELAGLFGIDILFFAILANHLHLILRNRPDLVKRWTDHEVMRRAIKIFPSKFRRLGVKDGEAKPEQIQRFIKNRKLVREMRDRLSDISWFMRQLTQSTARYINEEEGHGGTVWQHRFKCRRILDEIGLIICGAYVDLNRIRAGECDRPETSMFTSGYDRIKGLKARNRDAKEPWSHDGWLSPIQLKVGDGQSEYPPAGEPGGLRASDLGIAEMTLEDYLSLLDWTGKQQRSDKRGKIPSNLPPILERLGMTSQQWLKCVGEFEALFGVAVGAPAALAQYAKTLGQKWLQRTKQVARVFAATDN